jgi:hypothetical protein
MAKQQHPIFPPWQKTASNLAKVTEQKKKKKSKGNKKEISSRFFRIMASPPLTSSTRYPSATANCPLLRQKASPGAGTQCCRTLYLLCRKEEKGTSL